MTRPLAVVPLAVTLAFVAPHVPAPGVGAPGADARSTGVLGIARAQAQIRVPARPPRLTSWQVQRFGRAAGTGGVCAYYSGYERTGRTNRNVFRRRACFPDRAQCRRWLYWAQSYYPQRELLKRCR